MQFFLYEIVARIVAIYLCVDCSRKLWYGLVERKIRPFNPDFLNWLNPWANLVADRDAAPVRLHASFLRYLGGGSQTPEHPPTDTTQGIAVT